MAKIPDSFFKKCPFWDVETDAMAGLT